MLHLDRIGRGADYPYYDCTYPGAVTELEENLAPLHPALAEGVRWRTAERFLGRA